MRKTKLAYVAYTESENDRRKTSNKEGVMTRAKEKNQIEGRK